MRKTLATLALAALLAVEAHAAPVLWANTTGRIGAVNQTVGTQRNEMAGPLGLHSPLWLGAAPSGSSNDAWIYGASTSLTGGEWFLYSLSTLPSLVTGDLYTGSGVGTKNGSAVAVTESITGIKKTILTLTALSVAMTDATTAGSHGSHKLYTFPEGYAKILGAHYNLTTLAGAGGIGDTAALVGSLGSVTLATDNATLTSTEADVIASTTGTLTGGAGALAAVNTTGLVLDGHTTAEDVWLNLAVPDAGSADGQNDTVAVSGTVTITWFLVGDI